MTRKGYLWLLFPAMLALTALEVLLSGRDLSQNFLDLQRDAEAFAPAARSPLSTWAQRGVSLLLLAVCMERIASQFLQRRPIPSPALTWSFLLFWMTTVAATAVLATNTRISHEYLYPLFLGLACTFVGAQERDQIIDTLRSALLLFLLAGWLVLPFNAHLVLDLTYSQGLLPGVPRFGGLSSHPVMLGVLAQTALVLLWVRPFKRGWLNASAWVVGGGALFLAQSKTAWLAFLISSVCLLVVRRTPAAVHRLGDPRAGSSFGVGLCLSAIAAVVAFLGLMLVADLPTVLADFFSSSQGEQLTSLTGRDRIWVVALEEWSRNPVFGYGLTMWDADHREAISMPNATHAHNQFIDTLGRSGMVGVFGLVIYALTLLVLSARYARATGGLSMALFLTTALLSVSEVPLLMIDYGSHVLTHTLLILVAASGAAERVRAPVNVVLVEPSFRNAT